MNDIVVVINVAGIELEGSLRYTPSLWFCWVEDVIHWKLSSWVWNHSSEVLVILLSSRFCCHTAINIVSLFQQIPSVTKRRAISHSCTSAIFNGNVERKNQTNLKSDCSTLPLNMAEVRFLHECEIALLLLSFIEAIGTSRTQMVLDFGTKKNLVLINKLIKK